MTNYEFIKNMSIEEFYPPFCRNFITLGKCIARMG